MLLPVSPGGISGGPGDVATAPCWGAGAVAATGPAERVCEGSSEQPGRWCGARALRLVTGRDARGGPGTWLTGQEAGGDAEGAWTPGSVAAAVATQGCEETWGGVFRGACPGVPSSQRPSLRHAGRVPIHSRVHPHSVQAVPSQDPNSPGRESELPLRGPVLWEARTTPKKPPEAGRDALQPRPPPLPGPTP